MRVHVGIVVYCFRVRNAIRKRPGLIDDALARVREKERVSIGIR